MADREYVMLEDKNGFASNLISQSEANPDLLREQVTEELNKMKKMIEELKKDKKP